MSADATPVAGSSAEPEPDQEEHEDGIISWEVCGHTLKLQQQPSAGSPNAPDADATGWRIWNSALVLAKYIEANTVELLSPRLVREVAATEQPAAAPVRVLDCSAGPGLLGLACAICAATNGLDAEVVITEMEGSPSLVQLEANAAAANEQLAATLGDKFRPVQVAAFSWGQHQSRDPTKDWSWFGGGFDLVLFSDLLAIAVLHDLYAALRSAMITVCPQQPAGRTLMLFAYEERMVDEEHEFLDDLCTPGSSRQAFTYTETPEDDLDLECTLDDGDVGGLFSEPAPVRILQMTRCVPSASSHTEGPAAETRRRYILAPQLHTLKLAESPVVDGNNYERFDRRWLLAGSPYPAEAGKEILAGDVLSFPELLTGAGEFEGIRFACDVTTTTPSSGASSATATATGAGDGGGARIELLRAGVEMPCFPDAIAQLAKERGASLQELYHSLFDQALSQQSLSMDVLCEGCDDGAGGFWRDVAAGHCSLPRSKRGQATGEWLAHAEVL